MFVVFFKYFFSMFIYSYEVLENTVFELNPLELKKRTEKLSGAYTPAAVEH